ncbi:DUF397 domain-containing protein [Streptomyces parvus]|uniref:DUF397 domain-containing protein n=1 Tax=Streptomyces parvus TaxID=66428 RepID=UPI0019442555|nr:DUF397 domain-containing protein [Streptomyces parvus]
MTHQNRFPVSTDLASEEEWTKSSYSSQDNGNCVETTVNSAAITESGLVGVRDSKAKGGPALAFTHAAWTGFVGLLHSGEGDFGVVD